MSVRRGPGKESGIFHEQKPHGAESAGSSSVCSNRNKSSDYQVGWKMIQKKDADKMMLMVEFYKQPCWVLFKRTVCGGGAAITTEGQATPQGTLRAYEEGWEGGRPY